MQWPTLIVDDFFTDPYAVVKLSKTLKYSRPIKGNYPGTRSPPLHEASRDFFLWSTRKIMTLLYPTQIVVDDGVRWLAEQHFQRVPYEIYGEEGWVHRDETGEITVIIYLSDHRESGTCLYGGKHFNVAPENNSKFRKKVELFSNFNRLVLFDGSNWHASRNSGEDKSDRLTLVTFFSSVTGTDMRYPITQMRRT